MRTRALWRFDEVKDEQRPIDAIGAVAELNQAPPYMMTANATRDVIGWGQWTAGYMFDQLAGNIVPVYGAPALAPVSTVTYGHQGPRGGSDRAVGFLNDGAFSGGNNFDPTDATDLAVFLLAQYVDGISSIPSGEYRNFWSKDIGTCRAYHNPGGAFVFELGAGNLTTVDLSATLGASWFTLGTIIEHGTGKFRTGACPLGGAAVVSPEGNASLGLSNAFDFLLGHANVTSVGLRFSKLYIAYGVGAAAGLSANLATALSNFNAAILSTPTVVDAAAGRGRSFVAVSRHGLEADDVDSGATLLTRNCSVQALVRWDLQEQGAATLWTLTKTGGAGAWGDAGVSSVETIAGDGYVEVVASETNTNRMVGLSENDADQNYTSIAYALQCGGVGALTVREFGVSKLVSSYATGDVLRVERVGTTVSFKKNGATIYTSVTPAVGALRIDTSFFEVNATLQSIRLVDAGARKAITWQNLVNVTATPTENLAGTIYARGKATGAAEYISAGLELRVANASLNIGELRWLWQDTGGSLKRQSGGYFEAPSDGSCIMLTATRQWIAPDRVALRYYLGGKMIGEVESTDGSIGGGTTGTTTVGARFDGSKWGDFFDGVIDELRVLDYTLTPEEVEATWNRITLYQPRGEQLVADCLPPGWPVDVSPDTDAGKELRITGQAMGAVASDVEVLREYTMPDRSFGDTLARWERITKQVARPFDDVDRRRARVIGHIRRRAGVSPEGVRDALSDLVATNPDNLELNAYSQEAIEDYDRPDVWQLGAGHKITKTGGVNLTWDAGASSIETLDGDGYLEFVASETTTTRTIGLSDADSSTLHTDILFGWYFAAATLQVRENGIVIASTAYATGDVLRIERIGSTIFYKINGAVFHTSAVASSAPLRIDSALFVSNATLEDIRLVVPSDAGDGIERISGITWTNVANATVTPAWFVPRDSAWARKVSGADSNWNAGAQSVETIAGDGYVEARATSPTNKNGTFGFSTLATAPHNGDQLDYAIQFEGAGTARVRQNGANPASIAYVEHDVFRIERIGSTVLYKKNGTTFYTSLIASSGALRVAVAFYQLTATIGDIRLADDGDPITITWENQANVAALSGYTRAQANSGSAFTYTGTVRDWHACNQPVASIQLVRVNQDPMFPTIPIAADGYGAHLRTKIAPVALPANGEVGIALYDKAREHAFLFGLRNDAGTYRLITERIVGGISAGVVNRAVTTLTQHWLRLFVQAPKPRQLGAIDAFTWDYTVAWSTTNESSGFTSVADIAHEARFQRAVLYARTFNGALGSALDVYFDDTRLFTPYGDRPYRFFTYRDPSLAGEYDFIGANSIISRLKHAHTQAAFITSRRLLAGDPESGCGLGPCGG